MTAMPEKLQEILEDFSFIGDRNERAAYLIEMADHFREARVPENIARQPYDERHRVPACESEAFVWAIDREDGTIQYYFDVLNPQGLSAMAIGAILNKTCSGAPLEQVAAISPEIVYQIFGKDLSMGKGIGLKEIVGMVVHEAKKRLNS